MVLTKCNKGHFYDGTVNESCPFCQQAESNIKLICIFGKQAGREYYLKNGVNHVGSGYQMDVIIEDDNIAEDNQCIFKIDKNTVTVVPAGGTITYVNGVLLGKKQVIKLDDVIRMGQCEYKIKIEK